MHSNPRPYWHVDAKWICGLLLVVSLAITLLLAGVTRLTERDQAIDINTHLLAATFSPRGLDDASGIEDFRRQLAHDPDGRVAPLPGFSHEITREQMEMLSPRELRLAVFRPLTERAYDDGIEGLAAEAAPTQREQIRRDAAAFGVLSRDTHETAVTTLAVTGGLSLLLLIGLVFFSHRFGRLVSPGIVFLLAGVGALPLLTIRSIAMNSEPSGRVGSVLGEVTPRVTEAMLLPYAAAAVAGTALLLTAAVGRIAYGITRKKREA